jgi:hypothetical protein
MQLMLQIKNAGSRWKVGCKGQGHSKDFKKPVFISYLNTLQTDTSDVMRLSYRISQAIFMQNGNTSANLLCIVSPDVYK